MQNEAKEILHTLFVLWFGFRKYRRELNDYIKHETCDVDHMWRNLWFSKTKQTDDFVKSQFGHHIVSLQHYEPTNDLEKIAIIVMYDQLPRNVFRGHDKAYMFDHIAMRHAKTMMHNFDSYPLFVQICLILVFIHSENISDQEEARSLQKRIASAYPYCPIATKTLRRITEVHHDHVGLFGRLPQRLMLNRTSELTLGEQVFLSNVL